MGEQNQLATSGSLQENYLFQIQKQLFDHPNLGFKGEIHLLNHLSGPLAQSSRNSFRAPRSLGAWNSWPKPSDLTEFLASWGPNSWPNDFPSAKTGGRLQPAKFAPQSIRMIIGTKVENKTCLKPPARKMTEVGWNHVTYIYIYTLGVLNPLFFWGGGRIKTRFLDDSRKNLVFRKNKFSFFCM